MVPGEEPSGEEQPTKMDTVDQHQLPLGEEQPTEMDTVEQHQLPLGEEQPTEMDAVEQHQLPLGVEDDLPQEGPLSLDRELSSLSTMSQFSTGLSVRCSQCPSSAPARLAAGAQLRLDAKLDYCAG